MDIDLKTMDIDVNTISLSIYPFGEFLGKYIDVQKTLFASNVVTVEYTLPKWREFILRGLQRNIDETVTDDLYFKIDRDHILKHERDDIVLGTLRYFEELMNNEFEETNVTMTVADLDSGIKRVTFTGNPIEFKGRSNELFHCWACGPK